MRPQPFIAVRDVAASSLWYQRLLGCVSGHGGDLFERLERDGAVVLQLHRWNGAADDHPNLDRAAGERNGRGVLLWFETGAFGEAVGRAREVGAEVIQGPLLNPNSRLSELWLRDPDGYVVVIAGADGGTTA